jgi:Fis family transcriptional regulator, factor for inversion stimulation protein
MHRRQTLEEFGSSQTVTTAKKNNGARKSQPRARDTMMQLRSRPLRDMTGEALRGYFRDLNGHKPNALYDLVLEQVEPPLFEAVLDYTGGNQSRAAEILGLNRATLRKKLKHYELLG